MVNIWDTRKLGKAAKPLHELPHAKSCQVPRVMLHLFYATGLYPTRRGIPPGVVSRPAWYPARHGLQAAHLAPDGSLRLLTTCYDDTLRSPPRGPPQQPHAPISRSIPVPMRHAHRRRARARSKTRHTCERTCERNARAYAARPHTCTRAHARTMRARAMRARTMRTHTHTRTHTHNAHTHNAHTHNAHTHTQCAHTQCARTQCAHTQCARTMRTHGVPTARLSNASLERPRGVRELRNVPKALSAPKALCVLASRRVLYAVLHKLCVAACGT
jgi:hypothetical protein